MAQTANVAALAVIEPLAGTAQAFFGAVGIGGTTVLLTIVSGWLFAQLGAGAFWAMAFLCGASLPIIWSLQLSLSQMAACGE